MERTARCQCGSFRVIATGEPNAVGICHCTECQRRSGVPLTYNAYFPKVQVRLEGEHKVYARAAAEGRKVYNHFCPTCGATVCWTADRLVDTYGIAVGAFNDPTFPPPTFSSWEVSKHPYVGVPEGVQVRFPHGRSLPGRS
jgi:hypothetical protein